MLDPAPQLLKWNLVFIFKSLMNIAGFIIEGNQKFGFLQNLSPLIIVLRNILQVFYKPQVSAVDVCEDNQGSRRVLPRSLHHIRK